MSASQRFGQWWRQRNRRERIMLAWMLAALAAFFYWYGLIWPARSLRDASRADYVEAVAGLRHAQAAVVRLQALAGKAPRGPGTLAAATEQRAGQAGIALARQRNDSDGQLVIGIDATDARTLFAWLELLRVEDGVQPIALTAERDGARLRAQVTFAATPP